MCGIIAMVGSAPTARTLVEGLRRLEYRGYDSAGVAVMNGSGIEVRKQKGKLKELLAVLDADPVDGHTGIAHTRWATHGEPNQNNSHPHVSQDGTVALVHNGIIENYQALKTTLTKRGYRFSTDTDTEVLANLIHFHYDGNLESAVREALRHVDGTYGIAVMHRDEPSKIVGARLGSPLIVGLGDGEFFLASDVAAMLSNTRQVIYLDDGECVVITPDGVDTCTIANETVTKKVEEVTWDLEQIEKGGFDHFMLKEIHEQPETIRNTFRGRVVYDDGDGHLGGLNMDSRDLRSVKRIVLLACGTSFHAGMVGEYMIEDLARIPVEVEYASEFRYRRPILDPDTLVFAISQSGETVDTLSAMREARKQGARVMGITNVVGSTIARESDGGVYIHAGPEIGVASTKAFTCQVTALTILTLCLARVRNTTIEEGQEIIHGLNRIPRQVQRILDQRDTIREIAELYAPSNNFLYLGRGYNYPIALEGALKLKEISYVHAEGYPAAEMKHGPIALIDRDMPVVVLCTQDSTYDKIKGNVQEIKARSGRVLAIVTEGDNDIAEMADHVITVPHTLDMLQPLLNVIPLQLLAYDIAVMRGCDVDQPRNLAKSVTVE
ncbi:MAG TPA: glutamine--fructose-6-phosphate transaminase (isomerizing) [Candidatus Krumholzibacteria bacterium]|nr:glutamine--fructose-6-phosphate transaminase (isomerizing) [Candidatus Krumholzibacteria bacterium]